jgi:hypothetical protein
MKVINEFITMLDYRPEYLFALPMYFEPRYVEFKDGDVPEYQPFVVAVYRFVRQTHENEYLYRFVGVKVK